MRVPVHRPAEPNGGAGRLSLAGAPDLHLTISLVVVTGRLLAGIDLRDNPDVAIDHSNRTIRIRIPPAKLIAVEIRDMQTYDERGGLWNPFTREDRDAIQRQARAQLLAAGSQLELLRHANESALEMLRMLLAKDGYTVDAAVRGA